MQNDISKIIIQSFAEIAKDKGIDKDLLLSILEDVFRTMIRKKYESDESFEVILNADRGEIQILHIREVVPDDELTDPITEITLKEALTHDPDLELYDEYAQEISITDFGRRAVTMARQQLAQRIREIEKDNGLDKPGDETFNLKLPLNRSLSSINTPNSRLISEHLPKSTPSSSESTNTHTSGIF